MATNVIMPKLGLTMTHGTVVKWLKQIGDKVEKGEKICEVETDKISSEVESPRDGVLLKIIVSEGMEEKVLSPICIIGEKGEMTDADYNDTAPSGTSDDNTAGTLKSSNSGMGIKISPIAKKLAEDNNIDYKKVKGTGPGGRILKEDIATIINEVAGRAETQVNRGETKGDEKTEKISGVRAVTAKRLADSKREIPHVYFRLSVNADELLKIKQQLSPAVEKTTGKKLTVNELVIKAAGKALDEFKTINVSLVNGQIIYHDDINIGFAVNTTKGLFVPVVKKAGSLSIFEINKRAGELINKARDGSLAYDDMTGGTFTVSNLGAYQIDEFFAIINPPESAILAVGVIKDTPCVENGSVVIRPLMNICLSADHRVIDGALAAQFLKKVKDLLENPCLLVI